ASLLAATFGSSVIVRIAHSVAFGDETEPSTMGGSPPADWALGLFRLAATPGRGVRVRLVGRLRERLPSGTPLAAPGGAPSLRARFADPARLAGRVEAWRRVFDELDAVPLVFVSLAPDDYDQSLDALAKGIEAAGERHAA